MLKQKVSDVATMLTSKMKAAKADAMNNAVNDGAFDVVSDEDDTVDVDEEEEAAPTLAAPVPKSSPARQRRRVEEVPPPPLHFSV